MGKINVLDSRIYNRIAAGEVVERPASIVKELIENSIDSGAGFITVSIENGGTTFINVSDNGCGIEKDDVEKAFLPHATSKIKDAADLDNILTLGFRGEALCSIAAVSEITLTSRIENAELAQFIGFDHGTESGRGETGAPLGTSVTVKNLFEKIPARKKFLQKSKAEEAEITSIVSRLILANNKVGFKYTVDGKTVFHTNGKGIAEAVFAVYGMDALNNLTEVNTDGGDVKIYGYVSRPGYSKYSRAYQTMIVNGRYVKNADISFAVYNCFKDYLMTRQYPMFVLFIDLPPDMVDINVNPGKTEAKFASAPRVISLLKEAINNAIYGESSTAAEIKKQNDGNGAENGVQKDLRAEEKVSAGFDKAEDGFGTTFVKIPELYRMGAGGDGLFKVSEQSKIYNEIYNDATAEKGRQAEENLKSGQNQNSTNPFGYDEYAAKSQAPQERPLSFLNSLGDFKRAGKLFDTYILVERGNNVFIIDQHAAHERLIFDAMYKNAEAESAAVQDLLLPYFFSLTFKDSAALEENLVELSRCGFVIKKAGAGGCDAAGKIGGGGTGCDYQLCGVPFVAAGFSESVFITELMGMIREEKVSSARLVRERIIMASCKAAVKGNDDLSDNEIDALLKKMLGMGVALCPHGRPAVITLLRDEIEKWFKRKV